MASILRTLRICLLGTDHTKAQNTSDENIMAKDVLRALFGAEKGGDDLKKTLQDIVGARGWTESIALAVLRGIEDALNKGIQLGNAMKEASDKAIAEATEFAHDHPYLCTLIALGILAILTPFVLEALGFAELGPVEGTFAAWWQSTYRGYVTEKSLFSYFQRLGMVWRRASKL